VAVNFGTRPLSPSCKFVDADVKRENAEY